MWPPRQSETMIPHLSRASFVKSALRLWTASGTSPRNRIRSLKRMTRSRKVVFPSSHWALRALKPTEPLVNQLETSENDASETA